MNSILDSLPAFIGLPLMWKLSSHQKRDMLDAWYNDRPVICPKHGHVMRGEHIERVFESQVIFTCPKCVIPDLPVIRSLPSATMPDILRINQTKKQIRFSDAHLRTMVQDTQEQEEPRCPVDNKLLMVERLPSQHLPLEFDFAFTCPGCYSWGVWIDTGVEEEIVADAGEAKEDYKFRDESLELPRRMELVEEEITEKKVAEADEQLFLRLYGAMAQTDCTACGYDCEGYARAIATGEEKETFLCVPGKEETADLIQDLLRKAGKAA